MKFFDALTVTVPLVIGVCLTAKAVEAYLDAARYRFSLAMAFVMLASFTLGISLFNAARVLHPEATHSPDSGGEK